MEVFQTSDKDEKIQRNWTKCEFEEDGESAVKDSFDLRQKMSKCSEESEKAEGTGSFDLRQKLSKHSPDAEEDLENNMKSPSQRRRVREHDLRLKLSRNRENQMDHSSADGGKSQDSSERGRRRRWEHGRARYTERFGGLSPLRSPRATTLGNILDLDNSRSHRFTKHLQDGSSTSPRKRANNQRTRGSDDKDMSPRTTLLSDSDDGEEITRSTPEYSRKASRLDRTSWTRRRLELPAESAEEEDGKNRRLCTITEEPPNEELPGGRPRPQLKPLKPLDKVRLARREKDIAYGKNTDAYRMYMDLIPRELRSGNSKKHPRTPQKNRMCSRRSWDAQVKLWKKRLHAWANENEYTNQETPEETSKSDGESPQPKNSWASVVARGRLPEEEESSSAGQDGGIEDDDDDEVDLSVADSDNEEDAHAFLDSADIDFTVAHQVQEQVRLDDA